MALAKGRNTSFLDRLYKNTVHIQGTILASFSLTFAVFSPGILRRIGLICLLLCCTIHISVREAQLKRAWPCGDD